MWFITIFPSLLSIQLRILQPIQNQNCFYQFLPGQFSLSKICNLRDKIGHKNQVECLNNWLKMFTTKSICQHGMALPLPEIKGERISFSFGRVWSVWQARRWGIEPHTYIGIKLEIFDVDDSNLYNVFHFRWICDEYRETSP